MLAEQQDAPDTPRLAGIVGADPIITNFVLRRINSAHYGLRRTVDNVRMAVMLLGFIEVCNITLTAGLMRLKEIAKTEEQEEIFQEIMRVSIGAAYFAQELAQHLDLPLKNRAFTVGLQHAMGRLVLLYNRPEDYEALWFTTTDGFGPDPESEVTIFGIDHAGLGAMAAEEWELPEFIIQVIRFYLKPISLRNERLQTLALTLNVAASATMQFLRHSKLQGESTGISSVFEPDEVLKVLAKNNGMSASSLADFITSRREEALAYIDTMIQS